MQKIIEKWWWVAVLVILGGIYAYGYQNMFFHQDDLDWLIMANRSFWSLMAQPLSDHINYLFRLLLAFEWNAFHLNFPWYLEVSVGIHAVVIGLLYKLARETSRRADLAGAAALIFAINTNWNEVVLWSSGQTISISVVFILLSMLLIWQKKHEAIGVGLANLTSALAIGLIPATFLVYGVDYQHKRLKKLGIAMGIILTLVLLIYKWRATDGTQVDISWPWVLRVAEVMVLGVINTVVGRLMIPFDRFEMVRIGIVSLLLVGAGWKWRREFKDICQDSWSRFLILQLFFYYLIVAVGRAQYGVGIMRAERYAYLGLVLVLLLLVRTLRGWQIGKWVWVIPLIVMVQVAGFYTRAQAYVVRPQQLRVLFREIRSQDKSQIDPTAYLPYFVLNDQRLKYKDILSLFEH
jgi:hypothetical protein